ncbi:kinesin-like protein KIF26A isoform X2 [Eriocheir sinensis]|uniref:kinesin-like protein KIF26A isoform X2 n=1 Tax=Eriocheir sinensis TaxID=95602 RepID=UPI0021C8C950|nr:kinesin-like protein KIF26A isoform X2 [Eriocheir sinensis]
MTTSSSSIQPEITFRWCRTERCRAAEVWLVLTSVTGTQVCLTWRPQLGWYEAPPTPVPCGLHTGFLHAGDKGRNGVPEWPVDAFHVSPHRAGVELFVSGAPSGTFLGHAPDLRRRYLHPGPHDRRWVSSTALPSGGRSSPPHSTQDDWGDASRGGSGRGGLSRGGASASLGDLRPLPAAAPSPAFSRAFRVAAELSSTSSRLLAGLSSGSSGVCLAGEEAGSPPHHHRHHHPSSSTSSSPDSEDALRAPRVRLSRARRRRGEGEGACPEVEVETALSAARTSSLRTEAALLRLDTLAQERRVARLLAESESDSDFEEEEAEEEEEEGVGGRAGGGQYGCVITFESRSSSLQDVGSPRALEDALVSLTSTDSHPEFTFEGSRSSGPPSAGGRGGLEPPTPAPRRLAWGNRASPDLAEDQDFLYESLGHEDQRVPLRLTGLDSEDSADSPRRRRHARASPPPSPGPHSSASGTTGHYSPHAATSPSPLPPGPATPPSPPLVSLSLESYEPTVREVKVAPLGGGAAPGWEADGADPSPAPRVLAAEKTAAAIAEEDEAVLLMLLTPADHDDPASPEVPATPGQQEDLSPASSPAPTPPLPGSTPRDHTTTTTITIVGPSPGRDAAPAGPTPGRDTGTTTTTVGGGDEHTTAAKAEAAEGDQDTTATTAAVGPSAGRGGVGSSTTPAADDSHPGGGGGGGETSGRGGGLNGRGGGDEDKRSGERGRGGRGGGKDLSQPAPRPRALQHAGTQTPAVTSTTRATSTAATTTRHHSPPTPSPTPHAHRPHKAPFTPLPDRLTGPWNQRPHHAHNPPAPLPYPPSPARSVLSALQQSLYSKILHRTPLQDSTHILHNTLRLSDLQDKGLGVSYSRTPHHHYRRTQHPSPPSTPPVRVPRYPVLCAESVLSSNMLASAAQHHLGGSAGDLQRQHHTSALGYASGIRVRGSASLPDLYAPPPPLRHAPRRRHTPDVMYSSSIKDRRWSSWRAAEDSDSGGSTDSLIDEAEHMASSASAPLDFLFEPRAYEYREERRQQRRKTRRRTRSHHGTFTAWQTDPSSAPSPAAAHGGSGRPYLPYRGDQLSPGQQVKVLAPGGGVAVARVIANQRGIKGAHHHHHRHHDHEDRVTVVLLCEPNRLQGSVVTVPLEKVLLAWPRA